VRKITNVLSYFIKTNILNELINVKSLGLIILPLQPGQWGHAHAQTTTTVNQLHAFRPTQPMSPFNHWLLSLLIPESPRLLGNMYMYIHV
jgi:hypothetical protein